MSSPDLTRIERIFSAAVEHPAHERSRIVATACGAEAELIAQVQHLLDAHDRAGNFLNAPTIEQVADSFPWPRPADAAGARRLPVGVDSRIGRYRLVRQIGEGGFGVVFMAEQDEPVQRRVAVKVVKPGMDSKQVVARFEQERQALAMMEHASIAKVFDGGMTDGGLPYFVMELVPGDPITRFCDAGQLAIADRLALFVQVCHAVRHAHQKGVIHRDIKPNNVLVAMSDGGPLARVIDFGIAKATAAGAGLTEDRQLIGTPEYMSPEQAQGSPDIDTRTDVYSLGVLLYELLTASTPFGDATLRSASPLDIQRIICETEPLKPSTRLVQSDATLAGVAARRRTDPRRLAATVRGELDWIVMKAVDKDRSRRYETADGLASDVARYLNGEPVLAAPASRLYRLKKVVRRNPVLVAAAMAVAATVSLGSPFLVTAVLNSRAAERSAVKQRDRAIAAEEEQGRQRVKAQRVARFMEEMLSGVRPSVARGRDTVMLNEMLSLAAERIQRGELAENPEAEVRLRRTIGVTYADISQYDLADAMLTESLRLAGQIWAGDHEEKALSITALGWLRSQYQGRSAEAERLFREALALNKRLHPSDHPDVALALHNLAGALGDGDRAAEAEPLLREALLMERRLFQGDHTQVADSLGDLGHVLRVLGRPRDAQPFIAESLAMRTRLFPGNHPDVAMSLNNMAAVLREVGDAAAAEPLSREALAMRRRIYRDDHPDVAMSLANLGDVLYALQRADEAETLYREALAMRERLNHGDHPDTARAMTLLARCLQAVGDDPGALALAREAAAMASRILPERHPVRRLCESNLAEITGRESK